MSYMLYVYKSHTRHISSHGVVIFIIYLRECIAPETVLAALQITASHPDLRKRKENVTSEQKLTWTASTIIAHIEGQWTCDSFIESNLLIF